MSSHTHISPCWWRQSVYHLHRFINLVPSGHEQLMHSFISQTRQSLIVCITLHWRHSILILSPHALQSTSRTTNDHLASVTWKKFNGLNCQLGLLRGSQIVQSDKTMILVLRCGISRWWTLWQRISFSFRLFGIHVSQFTASFSMES